MNLGLLILHVVVGLVWCGHGSQKLFGWFGARRRGSLQEEFSSLGYRPPLVFGRLAGTAELGAGVLLVLGFAVPVGAVVLAFVAAHAAAVAKWRNGPWIQDDGYEYLLVLMAAAIALAGAGPGRWSLDHLLGTGHSGTVAALVAIGAALLAPLMPRSLPFARAAGPPSDAGRREL